VESLDETSTNEGVLGALKKVTKALKRTGQEFNVNATDALMDDLQDAMGVSGEISQALTAATPHDLPDDDELRRELMGEEEEEEVIQFPRAPSAVPVVGKEKRVPVPV
jgi:hypothetical protein